jgi:TonB family protein
MRLVSFLLLFLGAKLSCFGQTATAPPGLPNDPRAILDAAAPLYDFSDPALKPWHLKATYQLYDDSGNPAEQGTFEYWWASPTVYRSTWSRPSGSRSDWHAADGKRAYLAAGEGPSLFEYKLQSGLLSPILKSDSLDPSKTRLERDQVKLGSANLSCVMVLPEMPQRGGTQAVPIGLFPTYCFEPSQPQLRVSFSFGTVTEAFNSIVKVQGRYLAKEILFVEDNRKILTASVDTIGGISPSDSALTPDPQAIYPNVSELPVSAGTAVGMLLTKVTPVYPQDAKAAHISGTVVLRATIGREGNIIDLQVVEAPSPSLAASAMRAVSRWRYKPYLLNGEPVEVKTRVNVIYQLGH